MGGRISLRLPTEKGIDCSQELAPPISNNCATYEFDFGPGWLAPSQEAKFFIVTRESFQSLLGSYDRDTKDHEVFIARLEAAPFDEWGWQVASFRGIRL